MSTAQSSPSSTPKSSSAPQNSATTQNTNIILSFIPHSPSPTSPIFIKITLSIEKGQYNTWSELFKIHARVHQVIDHIIPSEITSCPNLKDTDPNLWARLDDVVLQ